MCGSVVQLNPGIVSFTGRAGKARSRSAPRTVDQRHLHIAFSQGFISKAVQGLEVTCIQLGGTLYTRGYTRDLKTEVNVMLVLLRLLNAMPSSVAAVPCLSDL